MSRLDDELKIAFRRQEPSADFAARVLARLNEAPPPQPTLWQRLAGWFAAPALRWAALGAMALLLVIIGVTLLRPQRAAGVDNNRLQAGAHAFGPAEIKKAPGAPGGGTWAATTTRPNEAAAAPHEDGRRHRVHHHAGALANKQEPKPSAEAEAAKEKVLFALRITSATLNDAQRAISDHQDDEKPEPVQNR